MDSQYEKITSECNSLLETAQRHLSNGEKKECYDIYIAVITRMFQFHQANKTKLKKNLSTDMTNRIKKLLSEAERLKGFLKTPRATTPKSNKSPERKQPSSGGESAMKKDGTDTGDNVMMKPSPPVLPQKKVRRKKEEAKISKLKKKNRALETTISNLKAYITSFLHTGEGWLFKPNSRGKVEKSWKLHYVRFNSQFTSFSCFKSPDDKNPKQTIKIPSGSFCEQVTVKSKSFTFRLVGVEEGKGHWEHYFAASHEMEMKRWLTCLDLFSKGWDPVAAANQFAKEEEEKENARIDVLERQRMMDGFQDFQKGSKKKGSVLDLIKKKMSFSSGTEFAELVKPGKSLKAKKSKKKVDEVQKQIDEMDLEIKRKKEQLKRKKLKPVPRDLLNQFLND